MVYEYFEHQADIGIIGIGNSLEEAFEEAAKAMIQIMADINTIEDKEKYDIFIKAKDKEELFIEWLNEILGQMDLNGVLFSKFKIEIKKNKEYILKGKAFGEKIDPKKHHLKTEAKAASYSQLKVEKKNNKYCFKKGFLNCSF